MEYQAPTHNAQAMPQQPDRTRRATSTATKRESFRISRPQARHIWLAAQKLNSESPFGDGIQAASDTIKHLGYVQIDTISVIERAHHHIIWSRVPSYRPSMLTELQSKQKQVFEFWTHALSYVHVDDFLYFVRHMKNFENNDNKWYASVSKPDATKLLKRIRDNGPLSIQDVKDDNLVDKDHDWASRKPSKRVLEYLFYCGKVVIAARRGMVKQYELTERHFGWESLPKALLEKDYVQYVLERSLRTQGLVSIDSMAFLDSKLKPLLRDLVERQVKKGQLIVVDIEDVSVPHWCRPQLLEQNEVVADNNLIHILSPFDPLIIQRKRLNLFFEYEHLFEAYIPKEKRVFGYFSLPVLAGDRVVAMLDLKTDREKEKVLMQKWNWRKGHRSAVLKQQIESKLDLFERFQLGKP